MKKKLLCSELTRNKIKFKTFLLFHFVFFVTVINGFSQCVLTLEDLQKCTTMSSIEFRDYCKGRGFTRPLYYPVSKGSATFFDYDCGTLQSDSSRNRATIMIYETNTEFAFSTTDKEWNTEFNKNIISSGYKITSKEEVMGDEHQYYSNGKYILDYSSSVSEKTAFTWFTVYIKKI